MSNPTTNQLGKPFLRAEWRHLLMLSFAIDPDLLRKYVPVGTELDTWHGRTFVSIVGFQFSRPKLFGWPIPFHGGFSEVNLRFYVRRRVNDCWRRGVVFIKEIVPRRMVVFVARHIYGENFVRLPVRSNIELPTCDADSPGAVSYEWHHNGHWNTTAAQIHGDCQSPAPGSLAEFIADNYWAYSTGRDGATIEYRVEHPLWRIWPASAPHLDCDVKPLYGPEFVDALECSPACAFVADGSPVAVRKGQA